MDDIKKLSYIIPVYNTEKWLTRCLISVLTHKGEDVEIIIIDDGSTDNSGKIIDKFASIDNRIIVIKQKNRGVSEARNLGIQYARGEFILFVDSDDMIDTKNVEIMLEMAKTNNVDVVTGCISCLSYSIKLWESSPRRSLIMSGPVFLDNALRNGIFLPMVFGYLVRRELIISKNLNFFKGIIHEDELWTLILLLSAQRIKVSGLIHYYYRYNRAGSITSTCSDIERIFSLAIVIDQLAVQCVNAKKNKAQSIAVKFLFNRMQLYSYICHNLATNSDKEVLKLLCKNIDNTIVACMDKLKKYDNNEDCI